MELNTGEVGIVTRQNETRRLKPEIILILDGEKNKREALNIVDLANQEAGPGRERWIIRELLAGSYGVDSEEYFI